MFKFIFIFGRFCYACHCHHADCPFRDTATLLHSCYFIRAAKPTDNTASTAMNFLLCYTDNFHYSLKTGTKVNVSLHILKKINQKKTIRKNCLYIQNIYRQMQQKSFDNRHLHFQPTNSDKYGEIRRTQHYRRPDIPDSRKTPIRPNKIGPDSDDRPGIKSRKDDMTP